MKLRTTHKPETDRPQPPLSGWRSAASTLSIVVAALLLAWVLTAFVFQSYMVDGQSMETTLQNNDRLIVDKIPRTWARITGHAYIPHRGDIIIFNQANLPGYVGTKQLVKRVIGLPGDHVIVGNGKITIYNKAHPAGFNPDTTGGYKLTEPTFPTGGYSNITLKANQIFVCGDNRTSSEDSRIFGPVLANQIIGKLSLRLLPLNKTEVF